MVWSSRRGVTPIIAIVILVGIAVGMGFSTYAFVTSSQDLIFGPARQVQLETVNVTCETDSITWWIENTDQYPADTPADLYISDADGLDTALTRTGLDITADFTDAYGAGSVTVTPGGTLTAGERYGLELAFGNGNVETSCIVGGGWWDRDWDYRRPVTVSSTHGSALTDFPASVTLDTATLISNGKMGLACRDLRVVEDGEMVSYSIAGCDTASTTVRFTTDVAPSATEEDVHVYYGNPAASGRNVSTIPTRIVNGDFSDGTWTGWSKAPDTSGGTTEFWIDEWPDDGTCTGPQTGTSDGPCGYPASNVTLLSSATGDAQCSPGSGCPTPVLGDGVLTLDGSNDGGYNGNIRSDAVQVPGGVHLHWWHNLQGRSADTTRYDGSTRWNGTANATSSTEGEGVVWAVVVDGDADNDLDADDWIFRRNVSASDNIGGTHDYVTEKVIDVSGRVGSSVRVYLEQNQGGGGDDGLIQVDDLYWSDAAGNEITLSTVLGSEISEN